MYAPRTRVDGYRISFIHTTPTKVREVQHRFRRSSGCANGEIAELRQICIGTRTRGTTCSRSRIRGRTCPQTLLKRHRRSRGRSRCSRWQYVRTGFSRDVRYTTGIDGNRIPEIIIRSTEICRIHQMGADGVVGFSLATNASNLVLPAGHGAGLVGSFKQPCDAFTMGKSIAGFPPVC